MKKILLLVLISFSIPVQGTDMEVHPTVLSAAGGRYVFGQINLAGSSTFMLDTQTGRLWRIVKGKEEQDLLQSVMYVALNGSISLEPLTSKAEFEALKPLPATAK